MEFKDIIQAQSRIMGNIRKTELRESPHLSHMIQGEVWLKLENLQMTHAFKIRGAFNKLSQFRKGKQGIITASSGNHGLAIARASREFDLQARIIIPEGAPEKKRSLIQRYGAEVIVHGRTVDQAEAYGRILAETEDKPYISPYNDPDIIAGQGTIGLELWEQCPDMQSVLVPIGGGGLISGIAMAIKEQSPNKKIIGVQARNDAAMFHSIQAGKILSPDAYSYSHTIADGLAGGIEANSITFPLVQTYVDEIILVREESIKKAITYVWKKEKLTVEGAGAVGLAAIMENPQRFWKQKIIIIISGGNINRDFWNRIVRKQV